MSPEVEEYICPNKAHDKVCSFVYFTAAACIMMNLMMCMLCLDVDILPLHSIESRCDIVDYATTLHIITKVNMNHIHANS